ncbi:Cold shock protein [Fructobacillus evanidus]|uniref:CspA family (CspC) n=3 Tax=Fructobacillus TaxID=559173 RepID=A0ABM9MS70_9LACO|nr:Cold shock protein [Fructobacillus tropaeoli]CAK1240616.1 Cold shock protein [Fructobacillus sp. LMG 32999]CAK1235606.1 Cold shock protein [Fructobacillus tropaeoli]CAK1239149.1 Cold shock protein [Fructobacillus tropaeoli]CAK1242336.1 Cold shock protein [Fructobacillus sp. LMG 32999]
MVVFFCWQISFLILQKEDFYQAIQAVFCYNRAMKYGTVKIWQAERGYGYITPDQKGPDVYVHFNGIAGDGFKSLHQGQRVAYVLVQGKDAFQAAQVQVIDGKD